MILHNGESDAAATQKPGDGERLAEIAADRNFRDRCDFDVLKGLVDWRADDQDRFRTAAIESKVAHAELDRRGETGTKMRVAQQDVGDLRLSRHWPSIH